MKLSKLIPQTKKAGMVAIAVVAGLVVGGVGVTQSEAALDWLGLEQKLENHDQQLDNHDDRITNVENDVEAVQEKTDTPPATERVVVREVVTQNPTVQNTPEPEPKPVQIVVVKVEPMDLGEGNFDCKLTFTDGSSKTREWKRVSGNLSSTIGGCSEALIGTPKSAN